MAQLCSHAKSKSKTFLVCPAYTNRSSVSNHPIHQRCRDQFQWLKRNGLLAREDSGQRLRPSPRTNCLRPKCASHSDSLFHFRLWRHRSFIQWHLLCACCRGQEQRQMVSLWSISPRPNLVCGDRQRQMGRFQAILQWCISSSHLFWVSEWSLPIRVAVWPFLPDGAWGMLRMDHRCSLMSKVVIWLWFFFPS